MGTHRLYQTRTSKTQDLPQPQAKSPVRRSNREVENRPLSKPTFRGLSYELMTENPSQTLPIQAKMAIRSPGDQYEQEADKVAAQVINQINTSTPPTEIQREEIEEEDTELQMKFLTQGVPNTGIAPTPELETSINRVRGNGQPISATIREPMEQAFGTDFSGVRVHTDAQSDRLNQSINAQAFTTGQDIFFRQGSYTPGNGEGQGLLAHELTHVLQQREGEQSDKVVQCKKTTKPANHEVYTKFCGHTFPPNVLANARNIDEEDDAIWQHLNDTYDKSLRDGTRYWNELQQTITNYKNATQKPNVINANKIKRAGYKSRFNTNYANTVDPFASGYKVNTLGYDPDQRSAPTTVGQGNYSNRFKIPKGTIEADWNFGAEKNRATGDITYQDEALEAQKGLNNSEILYRQFKLAARQYIVQNPNTISVKDAVKNISKINRNTVINEETKEVVYMAYPDGEDWLSHNQTWQVNQEEFKAILGTPNGKSSAFLLKDHIDQIQKTIQSITAQSGGLTIKFKDINPPQPPPKLTKKITS